MSARPVAAETLRFTLGPDELRFWSPQRRAWSVEPAMFDVWNGEDSTAKLHAEFHVAVATDWINMTPADDPIRGVITEALDDHQVGTVNSTRRLYRRRAAIRRHWKPDGTPL